MKKRDTRWRNIVVALAKQGLTLNEIELYCMDNYAGPIPSRSWIYTQVRDVPGLKREKIGRPRKTTRTSA